MKTAVDTGVLLHRARQAIAIMQRVDRSSPVTAMMACSQPVYAVEVVERPALLAGCWRRMNGDAGLVTAVVAVPCCGAHVSATSARRRDAVQDLASWCPERRHCRMATPREMAVLRSRGLADRVRDRMASRLQVGIGRVPRLQVSANAARCSAMPRRRPTGVVTRATRGLGQPPGRV